MIIFHKNAYARDTVQTSPGGLHFRYGLGFWESVYYNGHMLRHLDAHLDRLFRSLDLFQIPYAKTPFEDVAQDLLARAGLAGNTARVDIAYPVSSFDERAQPLVTAEPWEPDNSRIYELAVFPWHHASFLGAHRSMGAAHVALAQRQAQSIGCDASVITDTAGRVLEASSLSLLFSDGKSFFAPAGEYAPASVALDRAAGILPIRPREIRLNAIGEFRHAYVLGSLVGMRPVRRIGETAFEIDERNCELATLRVL